MERTVTHTGTNSESASAAAEGPGPQAQASSSKLVTRAGLFHTLRLGTMAPSESPLAFKQVVTACHGLTTGTSVAH